MIPQEAIPKAEFELRWRTAQGKMAELDLDVLLVHSHEADPSNVRYLADYWPLFETAGVVGHARRTGAKNSFKLVQPGNGLLS